MIDVSKDDWMGCRLHQKQQGTSTRGILGWRASWEVNTCSQNKAFVYEILQMLYFLLML